MLHVWRFFSIKDNIQGNWSFHILIFITVASQNVVFYKKNHVDLIASSLHTESFNVHTSSNRLMGTPMTAMIVGIAGGFLALLIMIAAVFCAVRRIQKNSAAANTPPNSRPTSGDHPLELSVVGCVSLLQLPQVCSLALVLISS